MIKKTIAMISAVMITGLLTSGAYAAPMALNDAQMDSVAAGSQNKVPGFVCTVNLHGDGLLNAMEQRSATAAEHVGIGTPSGFDVNGDFVEYVTVAPKGAQVMVPAQATNTGNPGAGFSTPGDTTYSPIWNLNNF
jgi:hypothetical protein